MTRRLKKSKIRGNFFQKSGSLDLLIWQRGWFCFMFLRRIFERSFYMGNMVCSGILSHKLKRFFRKANLASNASGAPNCPFHKSGKQGIWRAICENLPLCSGFSGLLRLPPQSPNTQNSSAATPRPGADVRKTFSIKYCRKEYENGKSTTKK